MVVEATLPVIGTVLITAAIDSINPCAIGVLILLISVMLSQKADRKKMLFFGLMYILAVYITYLVAGLGLIFYFNKIPLVIAVYVSVIVAVFIVLAALFEIKDFFWYGQGFSLGIPSRFAKKIDEYARKATSLPAVIALGVFVAGVELPCTGAPYLAIILLLSQSFNLTAFLLLVLYNFIFVLPLIAILLLVFFGVKLQAVKKWKQEYRPFMRLFIGLLLIALAWLLVLIASGVVSFD